VASAPMGRRSSTIASTTRSRERSSESPASRGSPQAKPRESFLGYGVEVQRQVEASYLRLPYTLDRRRTVGRVVIEAQWKPYSRRELWELHMEREAMADEHDQYPIEQLEER
jgi:hypothetical protein